MNLNKGKSLNRVINKEPDNKILADINGIFVEYLVSPIKPLSLLPTEFYEYFTSNERIISFRLKVPKSLTQKGDAILQVPRLWILYMFVMHVEGKPFKEILFIFKEAMAAVNKQDELLDGLNMLLEKFPEVNITADDENELSRLLGSKSTKNSKEVLAMSECGQFALVKLSMEQQKRLKNPTAIVPVKGNNWLQNRDVSSVVSFNKLLAMSNYTYHPSP